MFENNRTLVPFGNRSQTGDIRVAITAPFIIRLTRGGRLIDAINRDNWRVPERVGAHAGARSPVPGKLEECDSAANFRWPSCASTSAIFATAFYRRATASSRAIRDTWCTRNPEEIMPRREFR